MQSDGFVEVASHPPNDPQHVPSVGLEVGKAEIIAERQGLDPESGYRVEVGFAGREE